MKLFSALLLLFLAPAAWAQSTSVEKTDTLNRDSSQLMNVVFVKGRVSLQALRQQPVNISVIDARPYHATNLTGIDLLRQASGIKVRQNGGFGSGSDFLINGSSGRQVRFFIDGLPQDNGGETQLLNIFPVEQIERLEVYKGVLPVDLGADALGGAINIVTRKEAEDYLSASCSVASFQTHKLNLLGKKYLSRQFFVSVQAALNTAKNNYLVDVDLFQPNGQSKPIRTPLFHDSFRNYDLKLQAGYSGTRFADQLTLTLIRSGLYDELQHSLMMQQPYGHAYRREGLRSALLRYQKSKLGGKTDLAVTLSYNRVNSLLMDTSLYTFLWNGQLARDLLGQPQRKLGGGELSSSGHELYSYTNLLNGKLTAAYFLNPQTKLVFSNTFQSYHRSGRDPIAQKFYNGQDYFGTPSEMTKNIAGLGLEGRIYERWKYLISVKHYHSINSGFEIEDTEQRRSQKTVGALAYNAGIGYQLSEPLLIKISYEQAARLPEPEEAFGDFVFVRPNPGLGAEKSKNLNLNILLSKGGLEAELAGFFRSVNDLIYLPPSQFYGRYDNLLSVRILGVEGSLRYPLSKNISAQANLTFQDLRNRSDISNRPIDRGRYRNSRMPNIPYLFANGGLQYRLPDFLKKGNLLQFWYLASYTQSYFLYWAVDGSRELKNSIPSQWLQGGGMSFSPAGSRFSMAAEISNAGNVRTYDNFRVQLPGRSYSIKIRFYQFHKH